jgi:3-methyladenine DNA glycosylase Tag
MDSFDSIFQLASERKGGAAELEALLGRPQSAAGLKRIGDDRYLAEMTKCVFRSGFVWKIIENKWLGFEAAFHAFDVSTCAMLSEEEQERLGVDKRIVRHAKKIQSVARNAAFIMAVRQEHGGFGEYLAQWPEQDFVGLWEQLKVRGDRLGGQTGRFFLRFVGKDTPLMSADVVRALIAQGVVDKAPTSKRALAQVQDAFSAWREESGRPLCQISRVLSCSVGD